MKKLLFNVSVTFIDLNQNKKVIAEDYLEDLDFKNNDELIEKLSCYYGFFSKVEKYLDRQYSNVDLEDDSVDLILKIKWSEFFINENDEISDEYEYLPDTIKFSYSPLLGLEKVVNK